jgi:cholesterol transport system auxiliary component
MRYILLVFSLVVFLGCSRVVPSVTEYKIVTDIDTKTLNAKSCRDKSLKVAQAFSSSSLMSQQMNYTKVLTKQYRYSQAEWSESPNLAISAEFLKHIQKADIFKSVLSSKSRSKSDMILEINIEDFMQYFSEDESRSYVNVALTLSLLDRKNSQVLATKNFRLTSDVEVLNADGGVQMLNKTLQKTLQQSMGWLDGVCK